MRAVDKYLESALSVVDDLPADMQEKEKVKKVYKGYVASFGTIVKQAGLLPAAVLFGKKQSAKDGEQKKGKSEGNKKHVTDLLFKILKREKKTGKAHNFIDLARKHPELRREVIYAAVALKLALRTKEFTQ